MERGGRQRQRERERKEGERMSRNSHPLQTFFELEFFREKEEGGALTCHF